MREARAFVDTNVLLYGVSDEDPRKQQIARDLLHDLALNRTGALSNQVLREFAYNLIRKCGRSSAEAGRLCSNLSDFALVPDGPAELQEALRIMETESISFWGACIVSAASAGGCRTLFTEDLNSGQRIAGVTIVNPFAR